MTIFPVPGRAAPPRRKGAPGQADEPGGAVPLAAERRRDILVVVLTLTTGALDAVSYLRLGNVFSSVITGNLVLLGVGAGQQAAALTLNAGLALAGYGAGVMAGGRLAGTQQRGQPAWPARVTVTLAAELVVLAAFSAGWLITGGHPAAGGRLALLAVAAAAMGMQATAVRRLGQMSTTYLTSTLTALLTALATWHWPEGWQRSAGVLIAIVAGATLGAVCAIQFPSWVPAAVLIPLAAVLGARLAVREDRPGGNR